MIRKLMLISAVTLAASPAYAGWDTSRLSGPCRVPIYGAPTTDADGAPYTPITGYQSGVVFVLPADQVTPALQAYAEVVPAGVPVLAGVASEAVAFDSEDAAKGPLAAYWTKDQ
jgi:hypothetical protein